MTRTLADYRPQHDEECTSNRCGTCNRVCHPDISPWHYEFTKAVTDVPKHVYRAGKCSCGLDALLSGEGESRREQEENDSCAALLPADPSAAVQTETLPNWSPHGSNILNAKKEIIATAWPVADPQGLETAAMIVQALIAMERQ